MKEAKIEEELYRLITNVLEKRGYVIEGVRFDPVEPQYHVDSGVADLMLPVHPSKPLLIVECKRKAETAKGVAVFRNFDPMGSRVISQALSYAVQSGAPLFTTTNGKVLALFTTPERGEPFRIDRHRLLVKEIQLKEEVVEEILILVARWKAGLTITKTPVDWAFIMRLRSFVDYLAQQLLPVVEEKLKRYKAFKIEFDKFAQEVGGVTPETYTREAAYILMNKIVFYKILERYYGKLPKMKPMNGLDAITYAAKLNEYFEEAVNVTKDFEPIFSTGIYDKVPLPDEEVAIDEINAFIEEMDTYKLEEIGSDIVGFIYEQLIPDEERHKLGQFYTPPQIAELITKWAIREPTDKVLDPACGSGTFLVKAYCMLKEMKPLRGAEVHKEILNQIYGIDINPFPAHLTAVNLAMRDVRHPTSKMNVIVKDFFNVEPNQQVLATYTVKTVKGEVKRKIQIPMVEAVVANPPYTRWVEIAQKTRKPIERSIGSILREYGLSGGIGRELGIYIPFIIHATRFLSNNGRMGMIVSNSWLQTEYGINFGRFLLDNFKVKAVIDFSSRLFSIPLVATCVILLEKEEDKQARKNSKIVMMYIDKKSTVNELLDIVERQHKSRKFLVNVVGYDGMQKGKKWIEMMFNTTTMEESIRKSEKATTLGALFNPRYGNVTGIFERGGTGGDAFFYLTSEDVSQWGLQNFVKPALITPRYARFFTFTKKDWETLRRNGKVCYVFLCHKPMLDLPENVKKFIEWGGKGCKTKGRRGGRPVSKSTASIMREKDNYFCGWYDLGEPVGICFFHPLLSQYKHRFIIPKMEVILDDGFVTYEPRVSLTDVQIKALVAYLNSSFVQLYVESKGITTGGGAIRIDVNQASNLPIIDVRKVPPTDVDKLASLFDDLEEKARSLGRADRREEATKLQPIVDKIDAEIVRVLGLKMSLIKECKSLLNVLMERRFTRLEEARPEAVIGEEVPRIRPPRKVPRISEKVSSPLDRWI